MNNYDISIGDYTLFLTAIKDCILQARIQVSRVLNRELTVLYWSIGEQIAISQEKHQWGESIVEQLSRDLRESFPGQSGFSSRNLWSMRKFYLEYVDDPILQTLSAEIPWSQNLTILTHVKERDAREYYIKATTEMGWTVNILINQIKAQAFERHYLVKKQHNFQKALPSHLAEQADLALKDSYVLDFLGIKKPILEAELESRMIEKIREVILEFGYGFSFIGNQYRIQAGEKEYFIDLLFYNRRLQALVAIELKIGSFRPEYAGKMNFYLNLLDDFVREPGENPSIGIILCSGRDRFEVEYALRGLEKPMGVSEYQLTKILPKGLQDKLPNVGSLEKELERELSDIKTKSYLTDQ